MKTKNKLLLTLASIRTAIGGMFHHDEGRRTEQYERKTRDPSNYVAATKISRNRKTKLARRRMLNKK